MDASQTRTVGQIDCLQFVVIQPLVIGSRCVCIVSTVRQVGVGQTRTAFQDDGCQVVVGIESCNVGDGMVEMFVSPDVEPVMLRLGDGQQV